MHVYDIASLDGSSGMTKGAGAWVAKVDGGEWGCCDEANAGNPDIVPNIFVRDLKEW